MVFRISRAARDAMLAAAAADPDREVCGLMLGDATVVRIMPTANVATDPSRTFEIDPVALFSVIRAERDGTERLLGYYHSHPTGDPEPSECDRKQAVPDGRVWLIIGNGRIAAWRLSKSHIFETVRVELID
jgi:desampylase